MKDFAKTVFSHTDVKVKAWLFQSEVQIKEADDRQTDLNAQILGVHYLKVISSFLSPKRVYFGLQITLLTLYLNLKVTNEAFSRAVKKTFRCFVDLNTFPFEQLHLSLKTASRELWNICYQNHQNRRPFYPISHNYIEMNHRPLFYTLDTVIFHPRFPTNAAV